MEKVSVRKKYKQVPLKDYGKLSLLRMLRANNVKYSRVKCDGGVIVCILSSNFPRLNFKFDTNGYITVWRIGVQGYIDSEGRFKECLMNYSFPDTDCYRMLIKLLNRGIIRKQEICRLKL